MPLNLGMPRDWLRPLGIKRRHQVAKLFFEGMQPKETALVLDLGGPGWVTRYLFPSSFAIIAVNISRAELTRSDLTPIPENFELIQGDACCLPLADKSVDYMFADELIEHLPEDRWETFASEVRRVCRKGYMLITPNFWFPFEKHYCMPFWQFIPESMQIALLKRFQFGWHSWSNYQKIQLPTAKKLRSLFPEAQVKGLGFIPLLSDSLMAWHKTDSQRSSSKEPSQ